LHPRPAGYPGIHEALQKRLPAPHQKGGWESRRKGGWLLTEKKLVELNYQMMQILTKSKNGINILIG
jgi:hypothetical protein